VEEFVKVVRQTYVVSEEYASNGEVLPAGPGNGNFTWEGVFGWLEEQKQNSSLNEEEIAQLKAANQGMMAAITVINTNENEVLTPPSADTTPFEGEFEVFLQTHDVLIGSIDTNANHLSLLIIPEDQERYADDNRFGRVNGRVALTIGGNWGMHLTANFNRKSDIATHSDQNMSRMNKPNQYPTTASWVTALYNSTKLYKHNTETENHNIDYDLYPEIGSSSIQNNGHNSNSFIRGLLYSTETPTSNLIDAFADETHPGWNKPVPLDFFTDD